MIGFSTIATPGGFIIGLILGLIPLATAIYYRKWRAGILGYIACVLSGFACGFLGGIPMVILASAVVISFAYVNRQDPFTSLARLDEVDFKETRREFFMRQMASLGNGLRATGRMLMRNKAGFIGFLESCLSPFRLLARCSSSEGSRSSSAANRGRLRCFADRLLSFRLGWIGKGATFCRILCMVGKN
jgi:hypothetical protein